MGGRVKQATLLPFFLVIEKATSSGLSQGWFPQPASAAGPSVIILCRLCLLQGVKLMCSSARLRPGCLCPRPLLLPSSVSCLGWCSGIVPENATRL